VFSAIIQLRPVRLFRTVARAEVGDKHQKKSRFRRSGNHRPALANLPPAQTSPASIQHEIAKCRSAGQLKVSSDSLRRCFCHLAASFANKGRKRPPITSTGRALPQRRYKGEAADFSSGRGDWVPPNALALRSFVQPQKRAVRGVSQ